MSPLGTFQSNGDDARRSACRGKPDIARISSKDRLDSTFDAIDPQRSSELEFMKTGAETAGSVVAFGLSSALIPLSSVPRPNTKARLGHPSGAVVVRRRRSPLPAPPRRSQA